MSGGTTVPEEANLYLQLLKQCLSRSAFGERYKPLRRPNVSRSFNRRLWWSIVHPPLANLLSRLGFELVRQADFDPEACRVGRYYHSEAESMIGLTGLDNLEFCVTDCLRRGVPGDLLEAGVWRGGATVFMRAILKVWGDHHRKVWVADSFAGCPKPRHASESKDRHWQNEFLAAPLDEVRAGFERYGLLDKQVEFLPGWFCETLSHAPIDRLAVLRIDADMYSSTLDVLNALYGKVSPGGYVVVDDYLTIAACRRAVDEFRASQGVVSPIQDVDGCRIFWKVEAPGKAEEEFILRDRNEAASFQCAME
jgi:hypothetical protein